MTGYSTHEVAAMLGVHYVTARNWGRRLGLGQEVNGQTYFTLAEIEKIKARPKRGTWKRHPPPACLDLPGPDPAS
jgi:uncharacterized protein YjcR